MKSVQKQQIDCRADFQIVRGAVKSESSLTVRKVARAIFDTALTDSSGASNKTIAAHGLGVYLPIKAVAINAYYQVVTTFTSATDAATMAIKITNANDVVTAIAISDSSNPWDAGMFATKVGSFALDGNALTAINMGVAKAGSWVGPVTAEKELIITVATEALTAGKLILWVEYMIGE